MERLRIEKETTVWFSNGKTITYKPEETQVIFYNPSFVVNIVVSNE